MGLLGQAMAGFVSGAAGAGATLLHEDMKNDALKEREQAAAVRAENLQRLKQVHEDTRDDKKEQNRIAQEQRKDDSTITDYQDADGIPLTKAQVVAAGKTKREGLIAKTEAEDRAGKAEMADVIGSNLEERAGGKSEIDAAFGVKKKPKSLLDTVDVTFTPEEQAKIDAAEKTKILSSKRIAEEEKRREQAAARQEEILLRAEEERKTRTEIAGSNNATKKEIASMKGSPTDKPMTKNQIAVASEKQRKAMAKATTIEEADSINEERKTQGQPPLAIPSALKAEAEKSAKSEEERELVKNYKKNRSTGDAVVDALPWTPSAKEKALKGKSGSKSTPVSGTTAPTLDEFLKAARKSNPGVSDDKLKAYYNTKYK